MQQTQLNDHEARCKPRINQWLIACWLSGTTPPAPNYGSMHVWRSESNQPYLVSRENNSQSHSPVHYDSSTVRGVGFHTDPEEVPELDFSVHQLISLGGWVLLAIMQFSNAE